MKTPSLLLLLLTLGSLLLPGCVQPAHDKTVVYLLDVRDLPNVRQVGLRGRDKPLSWGQDLPLKPANPDSTLYRAVVTIHTGYLLTEVKFTVNGEFEFKDADNRRIKFGPGDTTVYRARFNVRP
jgi:putative oxidoreductase